jgi:hypothetical protein
MSAMGTQRTRIVSIRFLYHEPDGQKPLELTARQISVLAQGPCSLLDQP